MEYCNCSYEKYSCYYNINNCRYIDKLIKHFPLIEILLKNTTKKYNLINNNDYYIDIDEFNKLFIYIIGWIDSIDYKNNLNNTQIIIVLSLYYLIISNKILLETKIYKYKKILYVLYFKLIDILFNIEKYNDFFTYFEEDNINIVINNWLNILKSLIGGNL